MDSRRRIRVLVAHRDELVAIGLATALGGRAEMLVARLAGDDWPAADVAICDLETARDALGHGAMRPAILVVSHVDGEGEIRRAFDAGVKGYLLLDSPAREVAEAVVEICNGARYVSRAVGKKVLDGIAIASLTHREIEVVRWVSIGASNKVIAQQLDISVGTVKAHMRAVLEKLGAANRMEAAAMAVRRGLVPGPASSRGARERIDMC